MTHTPSPVNVPPYQLQSLISSISSDSPGVQVRCAQALGSEIYVGCSNGELLRFALQTSGPSPPESYTLLSRQSIPNGKPILDIALVPSISRVFVLSDRQVHFYTFPTLDPLSAQTKPIRHIEVMAVDELQLRRFALSGHSSRGIEPVDFCVLKRSSIVLYGFRDKLTFRTEMPFPSGGIFARRAGHHLCVADKETYHIVNLTTASSFPILPINQAMDGVVLKPLITVINENEFLLLSWTGQATMGVFITGDGDPVRGTLEWPVYPEAISLDYPYIISLLPSHTIEIHNVETQTLVQTISAPPTSPTTLTPIPVDRKTLVWNAGGFLVPSSQKTNKLQMTSVPLVRRKAPDAAADGVDGVEGGDTGDRDETITGYDAGLHDEADREVVEVAEGTLSEPVLA